MIEATSIITEGDYFLSEENRVLRHISESLRETPELRKRFFNIPKDTRRKLARALINIEDQDTRTLVNKKKGPVESLIINNLANILSNRESFRFLRKFPIHMNLQLHVHRRTPQRFEDLFRNEYRRGLKTQFIGHIRKTAPTQLSAFDSLSPDKTHNLLAIDHIHHISGQGHQKTRVNDPVFGKDVYLVNLFSNLFAAPGWLVIGKKRFLEAQIHGGFAPTKIPQEGIIVLSMVPQISTTETPFVYPDSKAFLKPLAKNTAPRKKKRSKYINHSGNKAKPQTPRV